MAGCQTLCIQLLIVATWTAPTLTAYAASIGPIPYSGLADSPFDPSGPGAPFVVDDFSNPGYVFYRPPGYPAARLGVPGVELSGHAMFDGQTMSPFGSCTNAIPPSCGIESIFEFDKLVVGFLPTSIGIAVSGIGTYELSTFDADGRETESATVYFSTYYTETNPVLAPGEIEFIPFSPPMFFVGLTDIPDISEFRVRWYIRGDVFPVFDDLQFGRLAPEPSTASLFVLGVIFCLLCRNSEKTRERASLPVRAPVTPS